ncbi:hypothetical protein [Nocardia sp. NPDC052112]|uniref:hypothetical protein n=1 Tax=Nocardia sp. NPDC052112 TaxID=3155646 RepID=UPI003422105D
MIARDGDLLRASATTTTHNETMLAVQRADTRVTNAIRDDINDLRQEMRDEFAEVKTTLAEHSGLLREILDRLPRK